MLYREGKYVTPDVIVIDANSTMEKKANLHCEARRGEETRRREKGWKKKSIESNIDWKLIIALGHTVGK